MALVDGQQVTYLSKRYAVLNGATILAATVMTVDEGFGIEYWPTLKLRLSDGQVMTVHVDSDPEGNGPGHLSGWELA